MTAKKTLVAYFSASGETARLARTIANVCGADLHEIQPAQPYTAADLNWNKPKPASTPPSLLLFLTHERNEHDNRRPLQATPGFSRARNK